MTARWLGIPALSLLLAACASAQLANQPAAEMQVAAADTPEAAGMVDIRTLVPDIDLEMRYASDNNFVGTRVDGYEAARCFLQVPAARALARVESALRREHRRLRIYDCYRPARAVRHFVAWAGDLADQRTKPRYYPNLDKRELLGDYISPTSGHSRGATLDLTLMQCDSHDTACVPLDMGTSFDFFGALANTDSPRATTEQRANRLLLRSAMERGGFRNYPMEWWHFTLNPEPEPKRFYDFVIRKAPAPH
jgi:D-alanyl-D-alanine dipeptidase